jgi:hypothetical protein
VCNNLHFWLTRDGIDKPLAGQETSPTGENCLVVACCTFQYHDASLAGQETSLTGENCLVVACCTFQYHDAPLPWEYTQGHPS